MQPIPGPGQCCRRAAPPGSRRARRPRARATPSWAGNDANWTWESLPPGSCAAPVAAHVDGRRSGSWSRGPRAVRSTAPRGANAQVTVTGIAGDSHPVPLDAPRAPARLRTTIGTNDGDHATISRPADRARALKEDRRRRADDGLAHERVHGVEHRRRMARWRLSTESSVQARMTRSQPACSNSSITRSNSSRRGGRPAFTSS